MVKGLSRVRLEVIVIELGSWIRKVHWCEMCLEVKLLKLHLLSASHQAHRWKTLSLLSVWIYPTTVSCWRPSRILEEREKPRSSRALSSWRSCLWISIHEVSLSIETLLEVHHWLRLKLIDFLQIARHLALRTWFITLVTLAHNKSSKPFIFHDWVALRSFNRSSKMSEVRKSTCLLRAALCSCIITIALIQNTLYTRIRVFLMMPRWQIARYVCVLNFYLTFGEDGAQLLFRFHKWLKLTHRRHFSFALLMRVGIFATQILFNLKLQFRHFIEVQLLYF